MPISGFATPEGTARYRARHGSLPGASFRLWQGLALSSIGLGTYLGEPDDETDAAVTAAARMCLAGGINVLDTAVNYRCQRGERALGAALAAAAAAGDVQRDEVFLSTKGGFIPFDGGFPADPRAWFKERYLDAGVCRAADVAAGCHCMAPDYLEHELRASLANLGVSTVDLYHVHNPETQLGEVPRAEFLARLTRAFGRLEELADAGLLRFYGTATWNGYRVPADGPDHLSFREVLACAEQAGGAHHRFRAVQMPLNMAMPEALVDRNQDGRTLLEAAADAGFYTQASGSILQGRLAFVSNPAAEAAFPGLPSAAQRALQFTRSAPGLTTALVGLKDPEHVREALALLGKEPAPRSAFLREA